MSQSNTSAPKPGSIWIISPAYDLAFLIAAPLVIFPVVTLLARYSATPDRIALLVFAFASLGHHLPGLMRAYGDRELFAQYRWRFLLAPPLILTANWLFFVQFRLHGLELILLFWATWHILMQTYGFMRIYDAKLGRTDVWDARLDFWTCIVVFAAGVVFADGRVYGIAESLWLTGFPLFGPTWLIAIRWIVGIMTVAMLAVYLVRCVIVQRRRALSWLKLLLLICTLLLYWSTGHVSVNLLIGVAMFEIFHALQYYAIVWFYNRRRAERVGRRLGLIGLMFASKRGLPIYLLAIAAFGALGFWGRTGDPSSAARIAVALFSASAMLHFYYDGFIWKVSQTKTRENLNIEGAAGLATQRSVVKHGVKWFGLAMVLLLLMVLEMRRSPDSQHGDELRIATLADLTPNLPEAQMRFSQIALHENKTDRAVDLARRALGRRPRSYSVHAQLGNALRQAGRFDEAARHLKTAVALAPNKGENHFDLAVTLLALGRWTEADESFVQARRLRSEPDERLCAKWVAAHLRRAAECYKGGDATHAAAYFLRAHEFDEKNTEALNGLGAAQLELGELSDARESFWKVLQLDANHAIAHHNLGNLLLDQGEDDRAKYHLRRAAELGYTPQL